MIGIINCDLDQSEQTNGAHILQRLIPNSKIIDVVHGEQIDVSYDKYIITGSKASITDSYEWIQNVQDFIDYAYENNLFCLGICFGMQIMAHRLGGSVLINKVNQQGFIQIQISEVELFDNLPRELAVFAYHNDIVSTIPTQARVLARNQTCIQAFQLNNLYCVQFHPEITYVEAHAMITRDKKSSQLLSSVSEGYALPVKIIENFLNIK